METGGLAGWREKMGANPAGRQTWPRDWPACGVRPQSRGGIVTPRRGQGLDELAWWAAALVWVTCSQQAGPHASLGKGRGVSHLFSR